MQVDSLTDLRTFALVVEAGSLSRAARSLGLSANAVSRRVARLESQLGTRLLARTTRSIALTPEGSAFLPRCQRALEEIDAAETEASRGHERARGLVRVAIPAALLGSTVLDQFRQLLAEHPALDVELLAAHRPVDLVRERIDLAVRPERPKERSVVARRLGAQRWKLAASPRYLAQRGRPRTPDALTAHECLRFLDEPPQRSWRLVHDGGEAVVVPVTGRLACDDSRVLGDATYAGIGIGIRPLDELERASKTGALEPVLPEWTFGQAQEMWALTPPGRRRARRVEVVLAAFRRALAQRP